MEWGTTGSLQHALQNGYIGEDIIRPKIVANAVRHELHRPALQAGRIYYYGTPDDYLKEKFDLVKGVNHE